MKFSRLRVEAVEPHKWKLLDDFSLSGAYISSRWSELGLDVQLDDDEPTITVRRDFNTDFGTTPRMMWWFCSPVDIAFAAVIHDRMYQVVNNAEVGFLEKRTLRKEADSVFLQALKIQPGGVPLYRIWICWACVRLFGWTYVNLPTLSDVKYAFY